MRLLLVALVAMACSSEAGQRVVYLERDGGDPDAIPQADSGAPQLWDTCTTGIGCDELRAYMIGLFPDGGSPVRPGVTCANLGTVDSVGCTFTCTREPDYAPEIAYTTLCGKLGGECALAGKHQVCGPPRFE